MMVFARLALACALLIPSLAPADDPPPVPDPRVLGAGFLFNHPDVKFRLLGMQAYEEGRHEHALNDFRRAAHWSDKPSQAMVAEMLWNGVGTPRDRAAAYAWMDLAAERGYPVPLALRERYWSQLDEGERDRALRIGVTVYARYGDAIARRRLETRLRFGQMEITGSRTGFVGALKVYTSNAAGLQVLDGEHYYADEYWKRDAYFALQDRSGGVPTGVVRVGRIAPQAGEPASE